MASCYAMGYEAPIRASSLLVVFFGHAQARPGLGPTCAMLDLVVYRSQSVGRLLVSNFLLLHSKRSL